MSQKIVLPIAVIATLIGSGAVRAEWTASHKQAYIQECEKSCDNNPRVAGGAQKAKCPSYCQCTVEEGEKLFSDAEFLEMDEAARDGKTTDAIRRFMQRMEICNRRTWGP